MNKKINKIILVQFRTDESRNDERKSLLRHISRYKNKLIIVDAFDESEYFAHPDKNINKHDKIILGGSGQFSFSEHYKKPYSNQFSRMIHRIANFIQHILQNDIHTMGICFGHQLLAHYLGSKIVQDAKQKEVGSFIVSLSEQGLSDPLFNGISETFYTQEGHNDSLETLPLKTIILAQGKKCKIQSFRYKKNIYGVQFHPELSIEDVMKKIKLYHNYTKNKKISSIIKNLHPTLEASRIINNFLDL